MGHPSFSQSFRDSFDIHKAIAKAARASSVRQTAKLADVVKILAEHGYDVVLDDELEAAIRDAAESSGVEIISE